MDKKRGSVLLIVGIVILVLAASAVGTGVYLYNFHVFKTVRLCVGEEGQNTTIPCSSTQQCLDFARESGMQVDLEDAPDFVKENFDRVVDEVFYCDSFCFIKEVRGVNIETGELEDLESCEPGESEFLLEIRGKEGLEIYNFAKEKGLLNG